MPVHTSTDGDTIYAVSFGNIKVDIDIVGFLASRIVSEAIISALIMLKVIMMIPLQKI